MDFRKLARALPAADHNINNLTDGSGETLDITHLPGNLLEALIPGYGLISRYIASTFGLDISIFVSIGLLVFGITKGGKYLLEQSEKLFRHIFMSSVYIDEHDDLFDMVMAWLSHHQSNVSKRSARAKTQKSSATEEVNDNTTPSDALGANGLFDYNKWSARTPPRFEPYYGRHMLWHNGRLFFIRRQHKPSQGQRINLQFGYTPDDDILQLDCIGRSTQPVRDLLSTIKAWSIGRWRNTTMIRHPTPKDRARFGGAWSKTSSRPSRPIETVILDAQQKRGIIKDMNEYLHPSSPKWYASRGIPYRRGYLFHGPPGTGKTSLSFALAGIFGLDIYAVGLQEQNMTEGDLMQLFNSLPKRCIVLVEDIDAAGLKRDGQSGTKDKTKRKGKKEKEGEDGAKKDGGEGKEKEKEAKGKKDEEFTLKDLARELKSTSAPPPPSGGGGRNGASRSMGAGGSGNKNNNKNNEGGISLSGLLNAIDGVATHEGRVLIMTTNHPEQLDAALVRPGRIDLKVAFELTTQEQVRELFLRMFAAQDQIPETEESLDKLVIASPPAPAPPSSLSNGHAKRTGGQGREKTTTTTTTAKNQLAAIHAPELDELALEFASHIPDDTFTPAEVQGYLLLHKKEPRTAVEMAQGWVKKTLEEKERLGGGEEEADDDDEPEDDED